MHTRIRILIATAFGLALACSAAKAQLMLSGSTTGSFSDLGEANTIVTNAADGSSALFVTGIPYLPANPTDTPTSIRFDSSTFTDVSSGENIQVGLFTIHNGADMLGSDAASAVFHLGLQLTSPVSAPVSLGTISFSIDNTPNGPGAVPDTFAATFSQPPPVWINGTKVSFKINFTPTDIIVPENTTVVKGNVSVFFSQFTPVPEPSTYAIFGAALLLGLVALRRFRADKLLPSPQALA